MFVPRSGLRYAKDEAREAIAARVRGPEAARDSPRRQASRHAEEVRGRVGYFDGPLRSGRSTAGGPAETRPANQRDPRRQLDLFAWLAQAPASRRRVEAPDL